MARHDFNQPCDCRECREISKQIICPACNICHVVVIDRIPQWGTDRKGLTYVDFHIPESPNQTLTCNECGHVIEGAGYFTTYDVARTRQAREYLAKKASAEACQGCGKLDDIDRAEGFLEKVQLTEMNGIKLCQSCLADYIQKETKDPSDDTHKYRFDRRTLSWKLEKIKLPCLKCGRVRWLNADNQWKTLCRSCYRGVY